MKNKLLCFVTAITLLLCSNTSFAQAPNLGSAASYALFTSVGAFNNTGPTVIKGDIGTNVGILNGFPPGVVMGQIHVQDASSAQAASDVALAYNSLSAVGCGAVLGVGLGNNQILAPNTYCIGAAATLNGNLILDGQGNTNAIFIFKIDGAFATGNQSTITLINGASLCNVFWQINGQFDLGQNSVFRGTALVNGAIHLLDGASLIGRALSRVGAISTINNSIVDVATLPIASTITANGAITFCAGGSVVLSGNVGGVWSTGATTFSITVTASGDYYVINTTNCGSIISNHIIVTVNPNPVPTITASGPTTFCQGGSVVLTASASSSYLWSTGATTQSITVSASGSYSVSVTDANG